MKYVLSDVHGMYENWRSILEQIDLKEDDELYILGDVIDRGKDGIKILLEIMESDNMKMLLGNHEHMMLEALGESYEYDPAAGLEDATLLWAYNGGNETYEQFLNCDDNVKKSIIDYLHNLPLNINVHTKDKKFTLCHAAPAEVYDLAKERGITNETKSHFCTWDRENIKLIGRNDDRSFIVFGHTPTIYFQPKVIPLMIYKDQNLIGIDCASHYTKDEEGNPVGRLACLRLDDMEEFYNK